MLDGQRLRRVFFLSLVPGIIELVKRCGLVFDIVLCERRQLSMIAYCWVFRYCGEQLDIDLKAFMYNIFMKYKE